MENYFLRVKTFSRGKGSSATKAAAYALASAFATNDLEPSSTTLIVTMSRIPK
jgi:hypothetical protein